MCSAAFVFVACVCCDLQRAEQIPKNSQLLIITACEIRDMSNVYIDIIYYLHMSTEVVAGARCVTTTDACWTHALCAVFASLRSGCTSSCTLPEISPRALGFHFS